MISRTSFVLEVGDLNKIYDVPTEIAKNPYYTSAMGIGKNNTTDNKVLDRLGYIVYLLEQ